jgi:tetratricopeptide (TPR) repeat protein
VGAIAYELLAYRRPFDGESLTAVMFKISHENADATALPKTDYSPRLEAIILRALARDVLIRYQSLDQMVEDLERLVRDVAPKILQRADPTRTALKEAGDHRAAGHLDKALEKARHAASLTPGGSAAALVSDLEAEDRFSKAARFVAEAREFMSSGDHAKAVERARAALALVPNDAAAQALARKAEGDMLGKKVEREMAEIRGELDLARGEGRLQKALGLCKRLLELSPDDSGLQKVSAEIEEAINDREVEQLCGLALGYATDGEVDLAGKIAGKIEKIAPQNPRYLKLKAYLSDETARTRGEASLAKARDLLSTGHLAEAHHVAEEALRAQPGLVAAMEIREAVARVLKTQDKGPPPTEAPVPQKEVPRPSEAPRPLEAFPPPPSPAEATRHKPEIGPAALRKPEPAPEVPQVRASTVSAPLGGPIPVPKTAPPHTAPEGVTTRSLPLPGFGTASPKPAPPPAEPAKPVETPKPEAISPLALTPLPGAAPKNAEAARLLQTARLLLKERQLTKALAALDQALAIEPENPQIGKLVAQTRMESHRADVESLTTAALDHFGQNDYRKARKAVDKALRIDPENKKAKELLKILGLLS